VDLHLLKQALEAKHFEKFEKFFLEFKKGYASSKQSREVFARLEAVEKRGRYKRAH
jgi:tRNA A-37 threonylcarbamoyl transferase component Bud32